MVIHFSYPDFQHLNIENITKIKNAEENSNQISFIVLGNINNSIPVFDNKMISNINTENSNFLISTGNGVLDGAEDKYRRLNKSLLKLNCPSIVGVGDQEVSDNGLKQFSSHYGDTNFSFSLNDSCFIFLDTTDSSQMSWQKQWLQDELTNYSDKKQKFIFMNKPAYQIQNHSVLDSEISYIKNKDYRDFLGGIFSKYNVTAVFASNIEGLDTRIIKGVRYYTSGGAGGILIDENNFYNYIKVDVNSGKVAYQVVRQNQISIYGFNQFIGTIWAYILSLFYINFINILIFLGALSLASLLIYSKIFTNRDYYKPYIERNSLHKENDHLKIAMFTNNYLPFIGGVPISINRLSNGLRRLGHEVIVFAPEYPGLQIIQKDTIRCKHLIYVKTNGFHFPVANIFSADLKKELEIRQFDIIHVHHPFWMGWKGLSFGQKKNIPVVLTYHTRLEQYSHYLPFFMRHLFKNALSHVIIKKFSQQCDAIIAPTEDALDYLRNIGVSRQIEVLSTGVDIDLYPPSDCDDVSKIRKACLNGSEILLCSVSRLAKEKNLYFLLNGLKYVKEHINSSFKCIIIGDGPEKDSLTQEICNLGLSNIVELLGVKTPEEIYQYYVASDLFVFASQSETQGMVILEAMAAKCPVVSVRSSGIDDVVENGNNGYKTRPEVNEWAEKVIELIENKEERYRMGENAYHFAEQHSVKAMSLKALNLYDKIIAEKNI